MQSAIWSVSERSICSQGWVSHSVLWLLLHKLCALLCFLNVSGSLDVDRSGNQNPFGKLGGCYPKFSRQGIRQAGRGFQAKGPLVENDEGAKPA